MSSNTTAEIQAPALVTESVHGNIVTNLGKLLGAKGREALRDTLDSLCNECPEVLKELMQNSVDPIAEAAHLKEKLRLHWRRSETSPDVYILVLTTDQLPVEATRAGVQSLTVNLKLGIGLSQVSYRESFETATKLDVQTRRQVQEALRIAANRAVNQPLKLTIQRKLHQNVRQRSVCNPVHAKLVQTNAMQYAVRTIAKVSAVSRY